MILETCSEILSLLKSFHCTVFDIMTLYLVAVCKTIKIQSMQKFWYWKDTAMVKEVLQCEEWFNMLPFSVLHFMAKVLKIVLIVSTKL